MPYTSSSITRLGLDKASFSFSINNFTTAKSITKTGQEIRSMDFSIGASKFNIAIFPNGEDDEVDEFTSVFLNNESAHEVTMDYTISIGRFASESEKLSCIESKGGRGWKRFVKKTALGQNITIVADITLVKEDIINGIGVASLRDWQFMKQKMEQKLEEKLEQKLEQIEQKLELKLEQKTEQTMEQKMEKKIEQKMEQKLEKSLEQKLTQLEQRLDQKIETKFEYLMENIEAPTRAPMCPICFEELRPPVKIIQCLNGHKLCEPCSQKPDVVSCPGACKSAFIGRDSGMEAFLLQQFNIRWGIPTELEHAFRRIN